MADIRGFETALDCIMEERFLTNGRCIDQIADNGFGQGLVPTFKDQHHMVTSVQHALAMAEVPVFPSPVTVSPLLLLLERPSTLPRKP